MLIMNQKNNLTEIENGIITFIMTILKMKLIENYRCI